MEVDLQDNHAWTQHKDTPPPTAYYEYPFFAFLN